MEEHGCDDVLNAECWKELNLVESEAQIQAAIKLQSPTSFKLSLKYTAFL